MHLTIFHVCVASTTALLNLSLAPAIPKIDLTNAITVNCLNIFKVVCCASQKQQPNTNQVTGLISGFVLLFLAPLISHCHMERKINFHKKHSVGHVLSPAATTKDNICNSHRSSRCSERTFVPTSPSIPDYHVPRKVLKRMVEMEYFGTSIPRQNTLY